MSFLLPRGGRLVRHSSPFQPTTAAPGDTCFAIGKPLRIQLHAVYTGDHARGIFNPHPDALVCSATKPLGQVAAAARAINFLVAGPPPRSLVRRVHATDVGTPLVHYTPAATDPRLLVTVEVTFDRFDKPAFDNAAALLAGAGAIPLFATASLYLLAGSAIARLAGALGEAIFDGKPTLQGTFALDLDTTPASDRNAAEPPASFALLVADAAEDAMQRDCTLTPDGRLVMQSTHTPYTGAEPYAVLRLESTRDDTLADFAPTRLSAELLGRFYNLNQNQPAPLDLLTSAMQAWSDADFRRRADALTAQLVTTPPGPQQLQLLILRDACLANIRDPHLRP